MKYIDAERLKVEIERLKQENETSDDKEYAQFELDVACGYDMACEEILSNIESLEQEIADAMPTEAFFIMKNGKVFGETLGYSSEKAARLEKIALELENDKIEGYEIVKRRFHIVFES